MRADDGSGTRWIGWLRSLRRAATWHRRLLAAGLAAGAVAAALHALAPPTAATRDVLVARVPLAAGSPVTMASLDVRAMPPPLVPAGALPPDADLAGAVLASPIGPGEVLTDLRLAGSTVVSSVGEGLVGAPVRVADAATTSIVAPGDLVDVLAARGTALEVSTGSGGAPEPAQLVASRARVVALLPEVSSGAGPFTGAPGGDSLTGAVLLLAVTPETAADLAGAAADSRLSITLRPERADT